MSLAFEHETQFDQPKAEAFAETIAATVNSGAVAVMLSIGHRTGLFDTMAGIPPASSSPRSRHMPNWPSATCANGWQRWWPAGIVEYEPGDRTYHLPPEHAACLRRDAPLGNLAVYAQFVPMAGSVQEQILDCFETGDGLAYDDYPVFPPDHGGRQRANRRGPALRPRPAAGTRTRRPAGRGHRRPRCRLRRGTRADSPGSTLPGKPVYRLRPVRGRALRSVASCGRRAGQYSLRGARPDRRSTNRTVSTSSRPSTPFTTRRIRKAWSTASTVRLRPGGIYLDAGHRRFGASGKQSRFSRSPPSSTPSRACTARRSRSARAARGWAQCGAGKRPRRC